MEKRIKVITRQHLIPTAGMKVFEDIQISDVNDTNMFSLDTDYLFYDVDGRTKILSIEKLLQNSTYKNKDIWQQKQ